MRKTDRNDRKKAVSFLLAAAVFLCSGCTKKSELLFDAQNPGTAEYIADAGETENAGAAKSAASEDASAAAENGQQSETQEETSDSAAEQQEICVHVCGAVKNPGVYVLPAGSRVYEAVQAAGGFTEEAHTSYVNQAQKLPDGVQLVIPAVEQVEEMQQAETQGQTDAGAAEENTVESSFVAMGIGIIGAESAGTAETVTGAAAVASSSSVGDGKININTASESELCSIPGIGTTRAAAILAYRQEHGSFQSIEDIMNVSGIKQGTYDKIKDSIKVN
jgi:competence protein ComEA